MAVFAYKGRAGGRSVADEIEADSRPAAVAALRAKGIVATAVRVKQAKAVAGATTGKKLGGKVKDKDLAIYTRQFSTMVDAGLPIAQSLQILSEQSDSKVLRDVTARIAADEQNPSVGKHRRGMSRARAPHRGAGRKGIRERIIYLRGIQRACAIPSPRDQHPPVSQQRRCVVRPRNGVGYNRKFSRRRIEYLRLVQRAGRILAADDQHPAVG